MGDALALFDGYEPLSPAELARYRGIHPTTLLAVDPDPERTCGNCGNARQVWIYAAGHDTYSLASQVYREARGFGQSVEEASKAAAEAVRKAGRNPVCRDADRWEEVCGAAEPFCSRPLRTWEPDYNDRCVNSDYHDEADCCNASCCATHAAEDLIACPPWPWGSAVDETLPACIAWRDREAEAVVASLGAL